MKTFLIFLGGVIFLGVFFATLENQLLLGGLLLIAGSICYGANAIAEAICKK